MCLYNLHKRCDLSGRQLSVCNSGYQGSGRLACVSPGAYWRQRKADQSLTTWRKQAIKANSQRL